MMIEIIMIEELDASCSAINYDPSLFIIYYS